MNDLCLSVVIKVSLFVVEFGDLQMTERIKPIIIVFINSSEIKSKLIKKKEIEKIEFLHVPRCYIKLNSYMFQGVILN
jgi:hypothetical protein